MDSTPWIPDSSSWIPHPCQWDLDSGFWVPIVSGILDSLSCIPDSKAQDSGFHNQNFPVLRIQRPKIFRITDLEREGEEVVIIIIVLFVEFLADDLKRL